MNKIITYLKNLLTFETRIIKIEEISEGVRIVYYKGNSPPRQEDIDYYINIKDKK